MQTLTRYHCILLYAVLFAPFCTAQKHHTQTTQQQATSDYAYYYIVIADTGKSYYKLHETMFAIHSGIGQPIDTMNRRYDAKEGIIVNENDEDEMYRGSYYPRRGAIVQPKHRVYGCV